MVKEEFICPICEYKACSTIRNWKKRGLVLKEHFKKHMEVEHLDILLEVAYAQKFESKIIK